MNETSRRGKNEFHRFLFDFTTVKADTIKQAGKFRILKQCVLISISQKRREGKKKKKINQHPLKIFLLNSFEKY